MANVFIGIGSNLGDRQKNIDEALRLLETSGVKIVRRSSIIETEPVGGPPGQDRYLNGVVQAETQLTPRGLLARIKVIERQMGRTPSVRNAPRIIDLDILLYDDVRLNTPDLKIPHPRMFERDFVLKPLTELKPGIKEK